MGTLGQRGRTGGGEGEELQKQEEGAEADAAAVLLFEADAAQVPVVDADDAVVLLEEALLLRLAPPLQTLDQQAQSPARAKEAREPAWGRPGSGTASTLPPPPPPSTRAAAGSAPTLRQAQEDHPSIDTQKRSRLLRPEPRRELLAGTPRCRLILARAAGTPACALGRVHPGEFLPFSHI